MERFIIKKITDKEYDWVCIDSINAFMCAFEHGKFSSKTANTFPVGLYDPAPHVIRKLKKEMRNWLLENHPYTMT